MRPERLFWSAVALAFHCDCRQQSFVQMEAQIMRSGLVDSEFAGRRHGQFIHRADHVTIQGLCKTDSFRRWGNLIQVDLFASISLHEFTNAVQCSLDEATVVRDLLAIHHARIERRRASRFSRTDRMRATDAAVTAEPP